MIPNPDTGKRPLIIMLEKKTHIFNTTLQTQLLSNFDQKSKIKSQEYFNFIADKKALITIIYG